MQTIETTATINSDGTIVLKAPPNFAPGKHYVVLVIGEKIEPISKISRDEIDAALTEMTMEQSYQAEALQLEGEFAMAQWEALQQVEVET